MSDRRLQVFHAVARHLSFTKAAAELHMTQPAVTFQIRQFEEDLNTRLFDRTHNRIALTAAGELVQDYAERIFALYTEMNGVLDELTGSGSGKLTIGASTTIADYVLPALLGEFKVLHPQTRIELQVSNTEGVLALVDDNSVDLGIVEGPVSNAALDVEVILQDSLVLVVPTSHELAARSSIPAEELVNYPIILREEGSGTREVVFDYLSRTHVNLADLNVIMELGSPEAIKGMVEAGMGVCIQSRSTLTKELALGSLAAVELDPPLRRPYSIVRKHQRFRMPATAWLLEFAREFCKSRAAT